MNRVENLVEAHDDSERTVASAVKVAVFNMETGKGTAKGI